MAGDYALHGFAVPSSLNLLHDLLERVRADHPDVAERDLSMFETAIVEIHGNVVEHGRPPGSVIFAFELSLEPDRIVGILADTGIAAPELSGFHELPDAMAESGRGLWLARATLDELHYARTGGRNTWKLVRRRDVVPAASV